MKINTFKRYQFTADLWTFTLTFDATGGAIYNYEFNRNITFRAVSTTTGRLMVFFKEDDADATDRCQLANFRDSKGEVIRPGAIWMLNGVEPALNLVGQREGFRGYATFLGFDQGVSG